MINLTNGVVILNPGHLKSSMDRGFKPTYSIVELNALCCDIQLIDYESGSVIDCKTLK